MITAALIGSFGLLVLFWRFYYPNRTYEFLLSPGLGIAYTILLVAGEPVFAITGLPRLHKGLANLGEIPLAFGCGLVASKYYLAAWDASAAAFRPKRFVAGCYGVALAALFLIPALPE